MASRSKGRLTEAPLVASEVHIPTDNSQIRGISPQKTKVQMSGGGFEPPAPGSLRARRYGVPL